MITRTARLDVGPKLETTLPGPKAAATIAADQRLISPSYTRGYPLVAERGEGMYIIDPDGNRFLDFTAGIAVCSTGHCHPEVVRAVREQAGRLLHMSGTDFYYPQMPAVAETLSRLAPMPGPHRFFFGNSGAEAIEAGIKVARYATRRPNLIAFYNAFHGRTLGALALTNSRARQRQHMGPLMPGVFHVSYPDPLRPPHGAADAAAACLEEIERLFRTTAPASEVAAIVLEPVQGEGGYIVPPSEFVRGVRRICDREGILLMADEVQSGNGRTGRMWAMQHHGVEPDIVCTAKGIASGLPLGVMFTAAKTMDWPPGAHASTFGGNPVALAAAEATLGLLERGLIRNAAEVGAFMKERMQDWPRRHARVAEVRGLGLMLALEIADAAGQPDPAGRDRIVDAAFERGLLVLGCGASAIRLMPPLVINREEAAAGLDILEACIEAHG